MRKETQILDAQRKVKGCRAFAASLSNAGLNEAAIAEKSMPTASLSIAHSRGVTLPRAMRLQRHKISIKIKHNVGNRACPTNGLDYGSLRDNNLTLLVRLLM